MRKVLNNYKKSRRLNGTVEGKIGTILGITDRNSDFLRVGDEVIYRENRGIILYDPSYKKYVIALSYSMWYGDNKYDVNSYGKAIVVPMDNGARMDIKLINNTNRILEELT